MYVFFFFFVPTFPFLLVFLSRLCSWSGLSGLWLTQMQDAKYGMASIGPISEELGQVDSSPRLDTGIEDEIRKQMHCP